MRTNPALVATTTRLPPRAASSPPGHRTRTATTRTAAAVAISRQMPAVELQLRLRELYAERVLASSQGLAANTAYMADLDDEIAEVTAAYTGAAVTALATFRAELFGPQGG